MVPKPKRESFSTRGRHFLITGIALLACAAIVAEVAKAKENAVDSDFHRQLREQTKIDGFEYPEERVSVPSGAIRSVEAQVPGSWSTLYQTIQSQAFALNTELEKLVCVYILGMDPRVYAAKVFESIVNGFRPDNYYQSKYYMDLFTHFQKYFPDDVNLAKAVFNLPHFRDDLSLEAAATDMQTRVVNKFVSKGKKGELIQILESVYDTKWKDFNVDESSPISLLQDHHDGVYKTKRLGDEAD
ncbi:hypothetical protein CCR75_000839 [Bremia lactucae]|uniref:Uncharacterized protein n=1 Tax=Bremia lactucae TaxID=4779 RepID=A0A976FP96_BRELC|nr:hypothetical protein CCR75_000839 [Bremia lactucae]